MLEGEDKVNNKSIERIRRVKMEGGEGNEVEEEDGIKEGGEEDNVT